MHSTSALGLSPFRIYICRLKDRQGKLMRTHNHKIGHILTYHKHLTQSTSALLINITAYRLASMSICATLMKSLKCGAIKMSTLKYCSFYISSYKYGILKILVSTPHNCPLIMEGRHKNFEDLLLAARDMT
jgi:hypothetical protein